MNCLEVPPEGLWLEELAQTSVEELFGPENRLPWELVLQIFFHLDISALGQAGCVNKDWKEVADSDVLWGPIYRHRFLAQMPLWTLAMADNSWKRACQQVALLPVIGTSCSGPHSGSLYTGPIVRVLQGVCVETTTDPMLIFAPSLPTCIQPVARIRPVPGDGPLPPTSLADLVQGKRKANHQRNVKSDLAREVLACLDEVDLYDADQDKALSTGPEEGDPLFELAKSQLLGKLLANKATGASAEASEDPMMDQLLATRYRTYNSAGISIRTADLTDTQVIVAQCDEDRYCMPGTITGLTSEGLIAIDAMTALPLNSFQRQVSLNTLGHSLHEDLMTALYNGDDTSLCGLEIFIKNGDHWAMSCITRVSKPCFLFEVSFEHWSKWFTLDQLQDFSQDMHFARKAFWRTVADTANVPPADPSLLGKRMLIQNKSQNLGGRIIQSHGPGTITSDPEQLSKIAYTYEKATDLAEGKYTVSRQYHVVMESSGLSCWLGAERLFHFTGAPDSIAVGDRVLSEWRPNNWYVGTITHATPGGWHVAYDDGDHQDDLAPTSLMHLDAARYVPPTTTESAQ